MAGERKRCYEDPKNKGKKPDQRDGLGGRAGDVHCVSLSEKTVDAVHDRLCLLCCLLGISDPEEDRRSKNVYWILLITRVIDVAIRLT